jgi:hypothetical protein
MRIVVASWIALLCMNSFLLCMYRTCVFINCRSHTKELQEFMKKIEKAKVLRNTSFKKLDPENYHMSLVYVQSKKNDWTRQEPDLIQQSVKNALRLLQDNQVHISFDRYAFLGRYLVALYRRENFEQFRSMLEQTLSENLEHVKIEHRASHIPHISLGYCKGIQHNEIREEDLQEIANQHNLTPIVLKKTTPVFVSWKESQ